MNLAFLLHIYQPPNQDDRIVNEIAESCYLPLLKEINKNQNISLTINIPLSLSHQLHENGYDSFLTNLKELYDTDRVELTSSGAYHPLLTKIDSELVEREIILNEYGLGYYFGKDKGFEGEEAIMVKNVNGFFPPEIAVSQGLLEQLDEMGYSWVVVDESAIPPQNLEYNPVYNFKKLNIKAVCRHTGLSNILSFKRDTDIEDFTDYVLMMRQKGIDVVVALDGEFFGHHHEEGIYVFETLTRSLLSLGVNLTTVSELIEKSDEVTIDNIRESTWGADEEKMQQGNIYPMWDNPDVPLHKPMWEIFERVTQAALGRPNKPPALDGDESFDYNTFPVWDLDKIEKIENVKLKNYFFENLLLLQSINSDQFWWASNIEVGGKSMFLPSYIQGAIENYLKYATMIGDDELKKFINEKASEIASKLEEIV